MGYTHRFDQKRHATEQEWEAIASDFQGLYVAAALPPIQQEDDDDAPPRIDREAISFNGVGDDGHETMTLLRQGQGFEFCKTAEKPYDAAVTALLVLANHHAPGAWDIGSDGDPDDWAGGLALARQVQPDATLPETI